MKTSHLLELYSMKLQGRGSNKTPRMIAKSKEFKSNHMSLMFMRKAIVKTDIFSEHFPRFPSMSLPINRCLSSHKLGR